MQQFNFYTRRLVDPKSAENLSQWCSENNIPNRVPFEFLHCSVITAQTEVPGYRLSRSPLLIRQRQFIVKMLKEALAIVFDVPRLRQSWEDAARSGVQMKYPKYIGHVSVSYAVPLDFDISSVKPPNFPIRLLPEESAPPYPALLVS